MEPKTTVPDDLPIFAKNFRRARQARGITQADMQKLTSIDQGSISDVERAVGNPTLDTLTKLAAAVGYTVSELLSLDFRIR